MGMVNTCDDCHAKEVEVRKLDCGCGQGVCLCYNCWMKAMKGLARRTVGRWWNWPERPNTLDE